MAFHSNRAKILLLVWSFYSIPLGMELIGYFLHFCRNGGLILFLQEWNGVIPFLQEWSEHSIPAGLKQIFLKSFLEDPDYSPCWHCTTDTDCILILSANSPHKFDLILNNIKDTFKLMRTVYSELYYTFDRLKIYSIISWRKLKVKTIPMGINLGSKENK